MQISELGYAVLLLPLLCSSPVLANTRHGVSTSAVSYYSVHKEVVGLLIYSDKTKLQIKVRDGSVQTYMVTPSVAKSSSSQLGALVTIKLDKQKVVTKISALQTSSTFEGVVSSIKGEDIYLLLDNKQTDKIVLSRSSIQKMKLETGSILTVTRYQDSHLTRVCLTKLKPVSSSIPVKELDPPVVGGGEPPVKTTPNLPEYPRALW